jgi:hypothetical protein
MMGAYTLHIVVTRKIYKKVTMMIFPNKIVGISAFPLRKPQLIRHGEQKNQRKFSRIADSFVRDPDATADQRA